MKLSIDTINILKYFSSITPNILISPGSDLSTMTLNKNIVAVATVLEDFPQEFGVYNLPEFLNVVSLFKDPELLFLGGKKAQIKEGRAVIGYTFAEPALMTKAPAKGLKAGDEVATFELKADQLTSLQKAMSILNLQDVIIEGIGGKLYLKGTDLKSSSSSGYEYELGDADSDFSAIIKEEYLRLMPGTHNVAVTERYVRFNHIEKNVTTWIGVDAKSKF